LYSQSVGTYGIPSLFEFGLTAAGKDDLCAFSGEVIFAFGTAEPSLREPAPA